MRHLMRISALLMVCLVSLLATMPVLAVPPLPSSFYGMVKINNGNVPDGTLVEALIGGQVFAEARTQTYQGNSVYALDVAGDDTDTAVQEGGREGDTIQFQIGGVAADQTGTWRGATNVNLDLRATNIGTINTPEATLTPMPTQTAIIIVQPSATSTKSAQPSPTSTAPGQSSPTATTQVQNSPVPGALTQSSPTPIPAANPEDGSSNNILFVAILVIVVLAIGLILLFVRKRKSMDRKSSETK